MDVIDFHFHVVCRVLFRFFQRARLVFSIFPNLYYIVYVQLEKIRLLFEKIEFRLLFFKNTTASHDLVFENNLFSEAGWTLFYRVVQHPVNL